ncbi:MAG: hypothetical protein CMP08_07680 [Xanthomonadales bacterium]|nr:hypothetical protein [Xanthomonadales bacterium]|tara:strand:+ start:112 stop:426 length:315 start_codon:yes stop_codon:yes gene_type:complete
MTDPHQFEKIQRENMRWRILQTAEVSHPWPVREDLLLSTVAGPDMPITSTDLRREVAYLERRELVTVKNRGLGPYLVELTRYGLDLAQYTIDCQPGIARPEKYW